MKVMAAFFSSLMKRIENVTHNPKLAHMLLFNLKVGLI